MLNSGWPSVEFRRLLTAVFCGVLIFGLTQAPASAEDPRYTAVFANGTRVDGKDLHDWHDPKSQPRLDNQSLVEPPVRWLQDNTRSGIPNALPPAFVELRGGDRLPGRVTSAEDGSESIADRWPPHVIVQPDVNVLPAEARFAGVRVVARWLRRVVWQRRDDDRYQPGTLFLRDGQQLAYRAIRWANTGVRVLLEAETREIPYSDLAELHLPQADFWDQYFEQLAILSPEGTSPLLQLETIDGLRATASAERFRPLTLGGGDRQNWRHLIQPAWALEPLWVRFPTIRQWRFFAANELPLTVVDPLAVTQRTLLGGGSQPRLNSNVLGGPLRSGDLAFGWGVGVQTYNLLEFPIPAAARSFQSRFALDRAVGRGGCVRAAVFTGPLDAAPLFQSPVIVGTAPAVDTGVLPLTFADQAPRRLALVADPVLKERPAGADPFEIRDLCDWLEPVLQFDPLLYQQELKQRASLSIPAWQDWTPAAMPPGSLAVQNQWDDAAGAKLFRVQAVPRLGFHSMSRKLAVSDRHKFLLLAVSRVNNEPCSLQVSIDKRVVGEFEPPLRPGHQDADPLLIPIEAYRGKSIQVEVSQMSTQPQAWLDWRNLALVEETPLLKCLFDEDAAFPATLPGEAVARFETADHERGAGSLRMSPGQRGDPNLGLSLPIRENPRLGEYRYVRFAWKKLGSGSIGLHLAHNGQFAPEETNMARASFRYAAGVDRREKRRSAIIDGMKPNEWQVVTRDLYADFGPFQWTGFMLDAPDGEGALFDVIYLARRREDLDALAAPKSEDLLTRLPADLRPQVIAPLPATVSGPYLPQRVAALFQTALSDFNPGFSTGQSGHEGIWLLKEFRARPRVLRFATTDQPCALRSPILVPAGKTTRLHLSVSLVTGQDWKLIVLANGKPLQETVITEPATKDGWLDLAVDLTSLAGQPVLLELQQHGRNGVAAYWGRLEVVTE